MPSPDAPAAQAIGRRPWLEDRTAADGGRRLRPSTLAGGRAPGVPRTAPRWAKSATPRRAQDARCLDPLLEIGESLLDRRERSSGCPVALGGRTQARVRRPKLFGHPLERLPANSGQVVGVVADKLAVAQHRRVQVLAECPVTSRGPSQAGE